MGNKASFILISLCLFSHFAFAQKADFLNLVEQALQTDPEYANKKSEVRSSDAVWTAATAQFLPDLTFSATQAQVGEEFLKQPTKYQSYLMNSQWNVFKFGSDWSNRNSAKSNYESKVAALAAYQIQFESVFSEKLLTFISVKKLLQIKEEQLASQKKLLEIANQRYQRGYLARQEVDKLSIDLDFIDSEVADLQNRFSQINAEISKRLSNLPPSLNWPWSESVDRFKIEGFVLEDHPSYIASLRLSDASDSSYDQVRGQFWGSLDLNLQWLRSNQINNEFTNQSATYLTLTVPLFNRMKDWSARRVAFEQKNQSENLFRQTKENLQAQYQKSKEIFDTHRSNFRKRTTNLKISRSLLDDNRARFQQGRISANELSIDQNRVYQAEQVAVNALFNVHVALKDFCGASGKILKDCLRD